MAAGQHEAEMARPARAHSAAAVPAPAWLPGVLDFLLLVNLLFLGLHLLSFALLGRVPRPLNLDAENNIPTWWSSTQLLLAAVLIGVLALRNAASPA